MGGRATLELLQTIAEIITRLEAIIAECAADNDRVGYFAVLYHRVTKRSRPASLAANSKTARAWSAWT